MKYRKWIFGMAAFVLAGQFAAGRVPPFDLWDDARAQIRDRSTLEPEVRLNLLHADVFFTSNPAAAWFDAEPPYAEHRNGKIRIHGFLALPLGGGPYPALVIGHGHGGRANRDLALLLASLGYVALLIDGPQAGQSTGGPQDRNQAWISVDAGPDRSYLYHYAYAGMRALTLLEYLADTPGNPFRIDKNRLGVLGASMGGMFATYINSVDDRVKAAVAIASAGGWHGTLRYPNSWLYHRMYNSTRDIPYNGVDPLNSVEDIDRDPTVIRFLNYFDPIRYASRQHAPVFTIIGTHDQYFPMPAANLMQQAIMPAGTNARFEKRLLFLPNAPHQFDLGTHMLQILAAAQQWLDYSFGYRAEKPLPAPSIVLSADDGSLRFEVSIPESAGGSAPSQVAVYTATRIDSTVERIEDFAPYAAAAEGGRFVVRIPAGTRSSSGEVLREDNVIYFATAADSKGLLVSSLMYKAGRPIDLSTGFVPALEPFDAGAPAVPLPPATSHAAVSAASAKVQTGGSAYHGLALTNPTSAALAAAVEARTPEGRIATGEGLINPVLLDLPPQSQRIFLLEEWLGPGARALDGSLRIGWSRTEVASLGFRGDVRPAELAAIGPLSAAPAPLWLPLAPEQAADSRRIRLISTSDAAAEVTLTFRNTSGNQLRTETRRLGPGATVDVAVPSGSGALEPASVMFQSAAPVIARLEVDGPGDAWSIDARPSPSETALFQSHVEWNGTFTTSLILVNTSAVRRDVRLTLRRRSGEPVGPGRQVALQPYETASHTVESLFQIAAGEIGSGSIQAESLSSPGGPVLVTALAFDGRTGAAAASPMLTAGAGRWSMPYYVENAGYYTGLAIANASDAPNNLTLTAYDPSGTAVASTPTVLGVRQSLTQLVSQWFPNLRAESGHIIVQADGPVALLAYFGTDDGRALAAIPFQRAP